jgi:hypothetical protein
VALMVVDTSALVAILFNDLKPTLRARLGFRVETAEPTAFLPAAPAILFAGLVSGGLGYTLQIVAQRYTPSARRR